MKKNAIELKWAIIFTVVSLLWMVLEKAVGLHSIRIDLHQKLTMLFMIPAIAVYVFALNDKKKNFYNGQMNYLQGFISGCIISIIVMIFAPLSQWVTSEIISPEYFTNAIAYSLKVGYHKSIEEATAYFSLKNYLIQSIAGAIVMGMITSAIVAFFVKSKSKR